MNNVIQDLLLVQSFDLQGLIEEYRLFFLSLLPSVFMLAVLIEYFDRLEPFTLVKRAFISILVLTSVTSFYQSAISTSMNSANEILRNQKKGNILLMDMFSGIKHWDKLKSDKKAKDFYKDRNILWGSLAFLKYHLFDSFINDGFTVTIYFITKICFLILKVVYSLVYYLGYGLIGVPCLIYLFPSMGNVLRGAVLSFLWCLVLPHVLVFILTLIGSEINKGYMAGQIIGGSMVGTGFLFILTLFLAFSPLITAMILNGSGISQAGGIIATIGANYVMNLPKNSMNSAALAFTGGTLGPKMQLAKSTLGSSYRMAKRAKNVFPNKSNKENGDEQKSKPWLNPNHYKADKDGIFTKSRHRFKSFENPSASRSRYKSSQSIRRQQASNTNGVNNNGTISKYGQVHRRAEKAPHFNRSSEHVSASSHLRGRDISNSGRKKQKAYPSRNMPRRNDVTF